MTVRYLIAGAGAAGMAAAVQLARVAGPADEIAVLEAASEPQPSKVLWPEYATSAIADDECLELSAPAGHTRGASGRLDLRLDSRLVGFALDDHVAHLAGGKQVKYDRLLLATGLSGARLELAGRDGPGVYDLVSLAEAGALRAALAGLAPGRPVVVIGGGPAGIRLAEGLALAGRQVTLCEMQPVLLPELLSAEAGGIAVDAAAALREVGVDVVTAVRANALGRDRDGNPAYLHCREVGSGREHSLPCGLLAICAGLSPGRMVAGRTPDCPERAGQGGSQPDWVQASGLVAVDGLMRTQWPDVFAAGDAAVPPGWTKPPGLWAVACWQGRQAAMAMAGWEGLPQPQRVLLTLRIGNRLLHAASPYCAPDAGSLPRWQVSVLDPARCEPSAGTARFFER